MRHLMKDSRFSGVSADSLTVIPVVLRLIEAGTVAPMTEIKTCGIPEEIS